MDIGANDEALQLWGGEKLLKLAAGEDSPALPLLEGEDMDYKEPEETNHLNIKRMTKEQLELLGLPEEATDEQIGSALRLMKTKADNAESLQLAALTQTVDQAIADRRILRCV